MWCFSCHIQNMNQRFHWHIFQMGLKYHNPKQDLLLAHHLCILANLSYIVVSLDEEDKLQQQFRVDQKLNVVPEFQSEILTDYPGNNGLYV